MIHNYGYKPEPRFCYAGRENPEKARTYGLELEVSTKRGVSHIDPDDLSERLDAITEGFVYCKSDCSVSGGLEMVTHPASLRAHMSSVSWKYFCKTCVKAGFRSHDADESAGLHIHVGRAQLGRTDDERDEVARKLTVLFRRYWPQLVKFSRRAESRLNEWAPCPAIRYETSWSGAEIAQRMADLPTYPNNHNARYTAVNLTNLATIEFRIFRGSLKRDTVIAAIQLVDNLCEYAMTHTWDDIQTSTWLDVARCKPYNELDQYLVNRGLMPSGVTPPTTRRVCDFGGIDGAPGMA